MVSVEGVSRNTGIVTKATWRNLELQIAPDSDECLLTRKANKPVSLTEREQADILRELRGEGRRITNDPIFRLVSLDPVKFKAEFALGYFHDYVCSTGALERELRQAFVNTGCSLEEIIDHSQRWLPLRHKFLPDSSALVNFGSRICAGGPNVLLAFKRSKKYGSDYVFFSKRRSAEVASGELIMSLIPMGYHQPTSLATAASEIPLAISIYRETFEELFGGTELEGESNHVAPLWYLDKYHPLAWFRDNPKSFTLEIVSFGLNLMHGNYEYAVLFAVHEPDFWDRFNQFIQVNWEVKDSETPLISTADPEQLARLICSGPWVGSSLFALVECLQRLASHDRSGGVRLPMMSSLLA